jgi:hypothetical protein
MPEHSQKRKHIRLKKSMTLPDDTLEYWGFYLMKGATVALKVCSAYEGSRILVVKDGRQLKTCGLMEHNLNKFGPTFNSEHSQVKVTFEGEAEVMNFGSVGDFDVTTKKPHKKHKKPEDEEKQNHAGEDLTDHQESISLDTNRNPKKSPKHQIVENSLEKTENLKNPSNNSEHQERKHRLRHQKKKNATESSVEETTTVEPNRRKRDTILDRGNIHGGNAYNWTENLSESVSFLNYGNVLLLRNALGGRWSGIYDNTLHY